ncbi:MAG: heavy metal-associated domain-containing protein [Planctomycetota bacterium]
MKAIAYVVAVLAAVGIVIAISSPPASETPSTATQATTVAVAMESPGELTMEVPGMHCQYACFPRVKETLENADGVAEVALAEQPSPDALTVKQVIVKYEEGFEPETALAKLHGVGFTDAVVMQ